MRPSETTPWRSTPCRSDPDDRRPKIRYPPFHPVSQEAGFFSLKGTEVLYFARGQSSEVGGQGKETE